MILGEQPVIKMLSVHLLVLLDPTQQLAHNHDKEKITFLGDSLVIFLIYFRMDNGRITLMGGFEIHVKFQADRSLFSSLSFPIFII